MTEKPLHDTLLGKITEVKQGKLSKIQECDHYGVYAYEEGFFKKQYFVACDYLEFVELEDGINLL